jgi:A/G-specific adenine glycosylase
MMNTKQNIKTYEIQHRLLKWYDAHARVLPWRDDPTPYRVWISEIMLQQTRVDTVKPYFERFIAELPMIGDLADVQEQRLLKLWEGLGYYSRARNLKKAALEIMRDYDGQLPSTTQELMKLPGIGPYSAGAIASIAFGGKVPAIDGNVLRVIARITANHGDITQTETKAEIGEFVQKLLPDLRMGDFNQALMELGATVCLPNGAPKCEECPVSTLCTAYDEKITNQIPAKTKKKARRIDQKTVFVIRCNRRTAIEKRPDEGLLQGLWEFPNAEGDLTLQECEAVLKNWGVQASGIEPLQKARHIFTHVEWHMTGFLVRTEECKSADLQDGALQKSTLWKGTLQEGTLQEGTLQEGMLQEGMLQEGMLQAHTLRGSSLQQRAFVWATPLELKQHYTIPTAFKAYMEIAVRQDS